MRVVIDRFEENMAVLELPDGKTVAAPKILFAGFSEGDAADITKADNSDLKNEVKKLMNDVWED